jgi:hypothetical protein
MADELSELNLAQDVEEVLRVEDSPRWKLEKVAPLELHVGMSSVKHPQEVFQSRLLWKAYPGEPPSIKFRDPHSGRLDLPTAWPVARGFRPANLDACVNYSVEGFALHPEWAKDANLRWNPSGNPLLKALRILQRELDTSCTGRFKQ